MWPGWLFCSYVYIVCKIIHGNDILTFERATCFMGLICTLENHCTRTAQSSCCGCSPRVHKIEYLAVNNGNILVNFSLLKIFIQIIITHKSSCVSG